MRPAFIRLRLALAIGALAPQHVSAHFGPAEPPDFGTPRCISTVDMRTTQELALTYDVGFDDTEPEVGHIWLPDSKTHQFFAFRGAVVPALPRYELWPFAAGESQLLPLWIDADDLQRADAANDPSIAPDFRAADIGDDVLRTRADVAGIWLPVSTAPARVPITIEQAAQGLVWKLDGVPAGVYQVAGYTFSPPYNAWEPRRGVIKLVDGGVDPPAATLDSIDGSLYAGQGRRITGCIDAPAGSTFSLAYSLEAEPPRTWTPWLRDVPVTTPALDVCFASREAQLSGMLRLRIAVRTPAGHEIDAYSPDLLVVVGTPASCTPSETQCCVPTPQPAAAASAAAASAGARPDAASDRSAGCSVGRLHARPVAPGSAGLLALLLVLRQARKKRREQRASASTDR